MNNSIETKPDVKLDKFAIASALRETGTLLNVKGENAYKARAYLAGAKAVESAQLDIRRLVEEERLTELPCIGASLAAYITDLYNTGETKLLSHLREQLPPGVMELSRVEGLTLKRIEILHNELGIKNLDELEEACRAGKVREIKGFGLRTEKALLKAIDISKIADSQTLLVDVLEVAEELLHFMKAALKTDRISLAGELRRWHETTDRICLVVETINQEAAFNAFKKFSQVTKVDDATDDMMRVNLSLGITAELHITENLALGLIEHTGSKEHYEQLQNIAEKQKLTLAPGELKKGRQIIEIKDEADFYGALKLPFIAPELREGEKEISMAKKGAFADLIEIGHIQGMTHCHSTFSDGRHSIEQMARAAEKMGMKYITLTDHSPTAHYAGGLDIDRLKEQWEEIDRVQELVKIRILKGTECDILADGKLDYPDHILDKFDIIVASIHSRYKQNEEQMTRRLLRGLKDKHFKVWGHPLGRLVLKRDPIPVDVEKLLDAVAEARLAIEINGDPHRLDLEPRWPKLAKERGLRFVISTDAHATSELQNLKFGIHLARRAGITKDDVLNTMPVEQFKEIVKAK